MRDFEGGADQQHQRRRHFPRQPSHEIEDRQQIDEPQRPVRVDEGQQIGMQRAYHAAFRDIARRAEDKLDREPQHIEIDEVQHLAIEEPAPIRADRS